MTNDDTKTPVIHLEKQPPPEPLAKAMYSVTQMIGTKPDIKQLTQEKKPRLFRDEKGTFQEMADKKEKGKKIVSE